MCLSLGYALGPRVHDVNNRIMFHWRMLVTWVAKVKSLLLNNKLVYV